MSKPRLVDDCQRKVDVLKRMRENTDWTDASERQKLLGTLYSFLDDWTGTPPRIRQIFNSEEIEQLIVTSFSYRQRDRFLNFLIESGLKDRPKYDEFHRMVTSRVTPLLLAAKDWYENGFGTYERRVLAPKLFKVYDTFDRNFNCRDDETNFTHFHAACMTGCLHAVEMFLKTKSIRCIDIYLDKTGETPLHLAVKNGNVKVVHLLLSYGADPTRRNNDGLTPVLMASQASFKTAGMMELLLKSFEVGPLKRLDHLNLNTKDKKGNTALHHALANGDWDMAKQLLKHNANPDISNDAGVTPLHIIVRNHIGTDLAEFFRLVDANHRMKVRVNARDADGNTPLHFAIDRDHRPTIELLLRRHKADPNVCNAAGSMPSHLICDKSRDENLAQFFWNICKEKKKSVEVNKKDACGRTPLQLAVKNRHPELCRLLLEHVPDKHLVNFRFPSEYRDIGPIFEGTRLEAAANLLWILEILAERKCEPTLADAMAMLRFLNDHGMFHQGHQREIEALRLLPEGNSFVVRAQETELITGQSLWDLLQLTPGQQQQVKYSDYSRIARTRKLEDLPQLQQRAFFAHMHELMLRDFCSKWAEKSLAALLDHELPTKTGRVIVDDGEAQGMGPGKEPARRAFLDERSKWAEKSLAALFYTNNENLYNICIGRKIERKK
ncbi:unnamed protein product [Trichogramma brassicae]|uniref:Uncharacterized protein n=1 Tax=Trichogramma brassicae TaxID=86971 RepID=A0A6H5IC90_9HYME|nr:unnamed protein product [Trichogramma brassicae]